MSPLFLYSRRHKEKDQELEHHLEKGINVEPWNDMEKSCGNDLRMFCEGNVYRYHFLIRAKRISISHDH